MPAQTRSVVAHADEKKSFIRVEPPSITQARRKYVVEVYKTQRRLLNREEWETYKKAEAAALVQVHAVRAYSLPVV